MTAIKPPRLSFTDLVNGQTMTCQFNPETLTERLGASWEELTVLGFSSRPLNFSNTENEKLVLTLFFLGETRQEVNDIHFARRFLKSLCFPVIGPTDVVGGSPPRVLVVWPQMLSMQCVVRGLSFTHQRFNSQARSIQYVVEVTLDEISDFRLSSDDVRDDNRFRYGDLPGFEEDVV